MNASFERSRVHVSRCLLVQALPVFLASTWNSARVLAAASKRIKATFGRIVSSPIYGKALVPWVLVGILILAQEAERIMTGPLGGGNLRIQGLALTIPFLATGSLPRSLRWNRLVLTTCRACPDILIDSELQVNTALVIKQYTAIESSPCLQCSHKAPISG
jgi:hypothetical protein